MCIAVRILNGFVKLAAINIEIDWTNIDRVAADNDQYE